MLLELLEKGFGNDIDLNCAEKMLYGANWAYDLKLTPEALKLAAGFGGGMGVESICGAITGGIMVLSHLYVKQRSHESNRIKGYKPNTGSIAQSAPKQQVSENTRPWAKK